MAEPVRGTGYDAGVLYEKDFESNPFFTEQRARRDFRAICEELGCDAGFGPGKYADDVASFICTELAARKQNAFSI